MPRNVIAPSALIGVATVGLLSGPVHTPIATSGAAGAAVPECRLRLPPPRSGEPLFAVPAGGRATTRTLRGRILLCTLFRADGSRFAHAQVDELQQVLEVRFFRRSGWLLFAADAAYPAFARNEGADVGCGSPANSSIGNRYWRETFRWRVSRTPTNLPRARVVHALRAAMSQWTNNVNWCNYADRADSSSTYEGYTARRWGHDGESTVDWGTLKRTQNCSLALACTITWYDSDGNPVESDIRLSGAVRWSVRPGAGDYDLQSVAAHEFGHARQFGHVTDASRRQNTVIMWPYITRGDTSGRKLGRGDALANNSHY
jgi:Matrixin